MSLPKNLSESLNNYTRTAAPRSRNKILKALALLSLLLVSSGCTDEDANRETAQLRPVRFQKAVPEQSEQKRTFSGMVSAGTESRLSFKIAGTLEQIAVEVGDKVEKGDLLARLDSEDYRLQVEKAEAGLQKAEAQKQHARSTYRRIQSLYESGDVSLQRLEEARTAFQSAKSGVQAARKSLQLAERQLSYTTLRAQMDGAVAMTPAEQQENIPAGHPVVVMSSSDQFQIDIRVPETVIGRINRGEKVKTWFPALDDQRYPATVEEVGVASVGPVTTYPVAVVLDSIPASLRSGMAANVAFTFSDKQRKDSADTGVIVPPASVLEDSKGRYVYVVSPDSSGKGTIHRRDVNTGPLREEGIVLRSGVQPGDNVITAGMSKIRDGQEVLIDGTEKPKPSN